MDRRGRVEHAGKLTVVDRIDRWARSKGGKREQRDLERDPQIRRKWDERKGNLENMRGVTETEAREHGE